MSSEDLKTKGIQAITKLKDITESKLFKYLQPKCAEYTKAYLTYVQEAHASGLLYDKQTLLNTKWLPYNIRYGVSSVIGFINEVNGCILYNKNPIYQDICTLCPEIKAIQVTGGDVQFNDPTWKNTYSGQCKTIHVENDEFWIDYDWFKYKNVDRLMLSDYKSDRCFVFDYPELKKYVTQKQLFRFKGYVKVSVKEFTDAKDKLNFKNL